MESLRCDVLVIGAGPAGSAAACEAAKAGAEVLLVERRASVGVPVQCAEYIPKPLVGEIDLGRDYVVQPIEGMKTFLPGGEMTLTRTPGYVIRRDRFDQALAAAATAAGATLVTATRAQALTVGGSVILGRKGGGTARVEAGVIIGADGPRSTVGKWAGAVNRNLLPGAQVTVPLTRQLEHTEIYFDPSIYAGYAWLFPKGPVANVGLGLKRARGDLGSVKALLDAFVAKLAAEDRVADVPVTHAAGWIPAEPVRRAVYGKIALVGDAAGQTHAITGAGIYAAVTCGRMVGKWSARAALENDPGLLAEYDAEWLDLFEHTNARAFARREIMERRWDDFEPTVRSCWVAFRDYYAKS